jgi:hypothetical protein
MDDNLEYLSAYSTRIEAEGIKGLLEDNGIKCLLQLDEIGDVLGSMGSETGPTKIYVEAGKLKKAREIANVRKNN